MRIKQKDWTTGRTVGTLASVWVGSSSLFYSRVRKYDNNVRWVYHMGQLRKSGDLNWFIDWRLISLQEKKKLERWGQNGSIREEGMRKKRSGASDYWEDKGPAVWALTAPSTSGVPPTPPTPPLWASHPIPSARENFLHSSITHLFLYSSLFTPNKWEK